RQLRRCRSLTLVTSTSPPPFPYTTLFRSGMEAVVAGVAEHVVAPLPRDDDVVPGTTVDAVIAGTGLDEVVAVAAVHDDVDLDVRSEEHTSELQSRENLVCRLLLEKKTEIC